MVNIIGVTFKTKYLRFKLRKSIQFFLNKSSLLPDSSTSSKIHPHSCCMQVILHATGHIHKHFFAVQAHL